MQGLARWRPIAIELGSLRDMRLGAPYGPSLITVSSHGLAGDQTNFKRPHSFVSESSGFVCYCILQPLPTGVGLKLTATAVR